MKRGIGLVLVLAGAAALVTAFAAGSRDTKTRTRPTAAPTWHDVAPIFADKCVGCHTPGGIAPFSLRNPRSAAAHARAILSMTRRGKMPPWMPGPDPPP